jgi:hypothetical protein
MPVSAVFENLEAGASVDEIIEQFDITREQINATRVLTREGVFRARPVVYTTFAARSLDAPPLITGGFPADARAV